MMSFIYLYYVFSFTERTVLLKFTYYRYTNLKIILLDYQNNYVECLNIDAAKTF